MVDELGVAVTELPVLDDKFIDGLQVYVNAPPAVNTALVFKHKVGVAVDAITTGNAFTVTGILFKAEQPFRSIPVTV